MSINTADWSYDDFLTFSLIYAAHADQELKEEEVQSICKKVNRNEFDKMLGIYQKQNDYQNIQTIMSCKERYCKTDAEKQNLVDAMAEILKSDQDFSTFEHAVLNGFKKLLT